MEPVKELPGYYRTVYHLRGNPLVSIIIPSKNNGRILRQCIDSIVERSTYRHFEIIVMDNGSTDPMTRNYLSDLKDSDGFKVVGYNKPFNYSAINNLGVEHARGDIFVFLNDDTEVMTGEWLERLGGYAQRAHIGAVGAKLLYPGGNQVQHAGIVNFENGPAHAFLGADADHPCYFARALLEYDWLAVTGACLVIERNKFQKVNGFDEQMPIAYNDVDLCFRLIKASLYNVVCQGVRLTHHESFSRGLDSEDPAKETRLQGEMQNLYQRHPEFYQYDPFHNPNLAPRDVWFRLPQ
jgi:O-antigen biosynthesis protein